MHHAITIGGLLCGIAAVVGSLAAALGALMFFAAGMSDASDDGTGGKGCMLFVVGLVGLAGSILAMVL